MLPIYMKRILVFAGLIVCVSLPAYAAEQDSAGTLPAEERGTGEHGGSDTGADSQVADPIEPLNRVFFAFNDKLYFWLLKPVAQGYGTVVPEWGRIRVRNVLKNISAPVSFVNSLLQLKMQNAVKELARFLVNTTAGIGGMFDILEGNADAKPTEEDLGQTLGHYGVGNGIYIVLPILGPSSLRDAVGRAGDYFIEPVHMLRDKEVSLAIDASEGINSISLRIGEYEDLVEAAVDPYTAVKDAYIQNRRHKIRE